MRRRQTLVVVLAGAILAAGWADRPAEAAPQKNGQVAAAYKKARKLYRQGRYEEAIKAFDEVKDLRYHPILDYGIASCYEALRDYNKAIYYLEKYVRNHGKFKMSPKHPSVEDVREKIKVLKARAQAVATGTAPPPTGTSPAASGTQTSATPGAPGAMPGDPVPGPDPYAVPPPPGGGSTGAVYGGGAPPPPVQRIRSRLPVRRSLMVSVDFGAASFASANEYAVTGDVSTGGGVFATALWRIIPWFAVGLHGGVTAMDSTYYYVENNITYSETDTLYFAAGMLEARGILPLWRLDLWGSLGIGYGTVVQPITDLESVSASGATLGAAIGVDWFIVPRFSIGLLTRIYKIFPNRFCGTDGTCVKTQDNADPGVSWYAGISATWHYPLYFGRRR